MKTSFPCIVALISLALAGCADTPELAAERERRRSPISIRGWIWDIEAPAPTIPGTLSVVGGMPEAERKARIYEQTYISVQNVDYASGGLIDTGAFIILDAPPRNVTMVIQTPMFPDRHIPMQRIPPNADVILPGIIIDEEGLRFADPEKLRVRIPGETSGPTGETALIAGHEVPIETATIADLVNRRDYPEVLPPDDLQGGAEAATTSTSGQEAPATTTAAPQQ